MEQFANLGTAAVLDADQLSVGQYTEIDGQVLVVTKIEGINVYFRPVTNRELWRYRWDSLNTIGKVLFGTLVFIVVFVLVWIIR